MTVRVRKLMRYSSTMQGEGWSIEAQEERCAKFIAQHRDWVENAPPYVDEAVSGQKLDRPGFSDMLRDARAREFDVLVFDKFDRFARSSVLDTLLLIKELAECGVKVVSATEPFDLTSPIGELIVLVIIWLANFFVRNLSGEVAKGKHARFEAGYWNGDLRFGYGKVKSGEVEKAGGVVKTLYKPTPNADAAYVYAAWCLCAGQWVEPAEGARLDYHARAFAVCESVWAGSPHPCSDQTTADALNAAGARTYRLIENAKKKATADTPAELRRPWTKDSVGALFNIEAAQFYLGHITYIGEAERSGDDAAVQIKRNTHDAIISQELHDLATAARARRRNPGRLQSKDKPHKHPYVFGERVARCSACGKPLRAWFSTTGRKAYYRCAARDRGEQCQASGAPVREDVLLDQFAWAIEDLQLPDDWQDAVRAASQTDAARLQAVDLRDKLSEQLRRINWQIKAGIILDDDLPRYAKDARKLKQQIDSIVIPKPVDALAAGRRMIRLRDSWLRATLAQKREIAQALVEAVYVDTSAKRIAGVRPNADFVAMFERTRLARVPGRDGVYWLASTDVATDQPI